MTVQEIMNKLSLKKKGEFTSVMYESIFDDEFSKIAVKEALKNGNAIPVITKETTMTVMSGITYDNRKEVKEGRANGTLPPTNAGLRKGLSWKIDGYILEDKSKNTEYVRLYPTYNKDHKMNAKTIYKVNGIETKKEDLKSLGLLKDSFFQPKTTPQPQCIDVNVLKIKTIG